MSGIAELLANLGYGVSGSDEKRSAVTERLATLGIRVAYGHQPANVGDADVVVTSSAVRPANPEVREAARRQIPVIPRAEMLGGADAPALRDCRRRVARKDDDDVDDCVRAGTRRTRSDGGHRRTGEGLRQQRAAGQGEYMVAEADESDRSFLKLFPTIAVMTNIDHEHLENYGGFDDLQQAFVDFANRVPFFGSVIACADDPPLAEVLPRITRRVTTYGFSATDADFTATDITSAPMGMTATVKRHARRAGTPPGSPATLGTLGH